MTRRQITSLGLMMAIIGGCLPTALQKQTPPPAVTPVHETWCYSTIGKPDCYLEPQDLPPGRLINVDPEKNRPLTPEDHQAVARMPR